MLLHGINNNVMYLFNKTLGASIGLEEPEPENIIKALSSCSRRVCQFLNSNGTLPIRVHPCVQYGNESDLYFKDDSISMLILGELQHNREPVYPFLHALNDVQPSKPGFVEKMKRVFDICEFLGSKNVTIHFPLDTGEVTSSVIQDLCSDDFLKLLQQYRISLDLENNWHNSWFGYAENVLNFYKELDDVLEAKGMSGLSDYFGMTFDSGHFIAQYRISGRDPVSGLERFFDDSLIPRIRTLHLHCNDGTNDQHELFRIPDRSDRRRDHRWRAFLENQYLILGMLYKLNFIDRAMHEDRWNLVVISEISKPFTWVELRSHASLIMQSLKK
ncbi:MAG: sugar phosphate isomerase/epimerase family protein [Promethearchaeota archaeon]